MSYSEIDPIISDWVSKHDFTLVTHNEGFEADEYRAIYLSSEKECCQISIGKPDSAEVCVLAVDIESIENRKLEKIWCVPTNELKETLETAVKFVRNWFDQKHT